MSRELREGFWHSEQEPWLPRPQPDTRPWPGQTKFVTTLQALQSQLVTDEQRKQYRGFSRCRCCGVTNGSIQFHCQNWTWPIGFLHYVLVHNVRPSLAFEEYVVGDITHAMPSITDTTAIKMMGKILDAEDAAWGLQAARLLGQRKLT